MNLSNHNAVFKRRLKYLHILAAAGFLTLNYRFGGPTAFRSQVLSFPIGDISTAPVVNRRDQEKYLSRSCGGLWVSLDLHQLCGWVCLRSEKLRDVFKTDVGAAGSISSLP